MDNRSVVTAPDLAAILGMPWSVAYGLLTWWSLPTIFAGRPYEPLTPRLARLALPAGESRL